MANKGKEKNKKYNTGMIIKTIRFLFAQTWKYDKSYFFVYILETLVKSVHPFINILFPKFLIDEFLGQRRLSNVIALVAVMLLLNSICTFTLMLTSENMTKRYHPYIQRYFEVILCSKIMRITFDSTENKEILDRSQRARNGIGATGGIEGIAISLSGLLSGFITLVGTVGLILSKSPLLLILVVINVAVNGLVNKKTNNIYMKQFSRLSFINRAFDYIHFQLSDIRYAKDIRLYHAEEMMLNKADNYNKEQTDINRSQAHSVFAYTSISNVNTAVTAGLSYLYLGIQALNKVLSIGDFSMMSTATATFLNSLNSIIYEILNLQQRCTYSYEFVEFMKSEEYIPTGEYHCDNIGQYTIEFKNVYFSYPGTDKYVLEDVSLKIENGQHLAIVGLNGSGKTTFIKLSCRLYPVNKGEILLNGVNIQDYDYKEYIKLISVVFQDFRLLPFTLKENIALKDAVIIPNKTLEPLIKKVGLAKKVEDLEKGMDTHLFRYYEPDGFEPSGGEQQKIAIARALYKDAPIVVLDEPTAALDPMAEYEIYKQFNDLVAGKTAFYISHRLSSCKFCDKIAVFSDGRITEYGTHQELMNKQGLYSEMFLTQAQYYS